MEQTLGELPLLHPSCFSYAVSPPARSPPGCICAVPGARRAGEVQSQFGGGQGTLCARPGGRGGCNAAAAARSQRRRSRGGGRCRGHTPGQTDPPQPGLPFSHLPCEHWDFFHLAVKCGWKVLFFSTPPLAEFNYSKSISKETILPFPLPSNGQGLEKVFFACHHHLNSGTAAWIRHWLHLMGLSGTSQKKTGNTSSPGRAVGFTGANQVLLHLSWGEGPCVLSGRLSVMTSVTSSSRCKRISNRNSYVLGWVCQKAAEMGVVKGVADWRDVFSCLWMSSTDLYM